MSNGGDRTEQNTFSSSMRRISLARTSEEKASAFQLLAENLSDSGQSETFLSRVLARSDSNASRFALELAARLRPIPELLLPNLIGLLKKPKFPSKIRIAVAANIIRQIPADSPMIQTILLALERKTTQSRAVERLTRLIELVPSNDLIRTRKKQLQVASLAVCPRCGVRLPQAEFVNHLWQAHQLRFDGGRVREPWQVIEDWVNSYLRNPRGEVLDRCCELAQFLDPQSGIHRVHDLLTSGGTAPEQHATMRLLASEKNASLCPHCFALVPFRIGTEPIPVLLARGVLVGGKLRIEIRDRFIANWLDADFGELRLHHGPEPKHPLTRRGVVSLVVLPLVLLAALCSVLPPLMGLQPMAPVASLLFLACLAYFAIRFHWDYEAPTSDRLIDHAWRLVTNRFLNDPIVTPADQLLVAGLAVASINHGDSELREPLLQKCLRRAADEQMSDALMASLMLLRQEDRDPATDEILMLAEQFGYVCHGKASWGAANRFFAKTHGDLKNRTRRSRLRILMLKQAFQVGLEAGDLRLLGRLAPEVGACYASEDRSGLARLRLLWLYRENRLWQQVGAAASVFDLAQYAQSYLEQRPDLLLLQPAPRVEEAPILICEEGIVYRDSILTSMEDRLLTRPASSGGGFELVINAQKYSFKKNPNQLLNRLIAWREFLFDGFLPRAELLENRYSKLGEQMMNRHLRMCDSCGKSFIGIPGETGLSDPRLDEDEE